MTLFEQIVEELQKEDEISLSKNAEEMKMLVKRHLDFSDEHFKHMSSKTLKLLVPGIDRFEIISKLEEIPGFEYDPDMRASSIGGVRFKNCTLMIKPLEKQGRAAAGVQNEDDFEKYINEHASELNPITVILKGNNKTEKVDNVVKAKAVGTQVSKYKKTDIVLERDGRPDYNISIKKSNAKYWESADSRYKALLNDFIEEVESGKHPEIYFENFKNKKGVEKKNVYIMMSSKTNNKVAAVLDKIEDEEEVRDMIFGDNEVDSVITATFRKSDFNYDNNILEVEVKSIITNLNDVKLEKAWPWLRIRHDSTYLKTKGLRSLVEMEKYIFKKDSDEFVGNVLKLKD